MEQSLGELIIAFLLRFKETEKQGNVKEWSFYALQPTGIIRNILIGKSFKRKIDLWEVTCKTIVSLSNFKPMYVYGYRKINTMISRNLFTITSREEKKL